MLRLMRGISRFWQYLSLTVLIYLIITLFVCTVSSTLAWYPSAHSNNTITSSNDTYQYTEETVVPRGIDFNSVVRLNKFQVFEIILTTIIITTIVEIVIFYLVMKYLFLQPLQSLIKATTDPSRENFNIQIPSLSPKEITSIVQIIKSLLTKLARQHAEHKVDRCRLRKERQFAEAILNVIEAYVILFLPDGQIFRVNRAFEEITGYSQDELLGRMMWDFLLVDEEIEDVINVFNQLIETGLNSKYENYIIDKDGHKHFVSWTNGVLLDEMNGIQYVIITGSNVSSQYALQRNLEEQLVFQVNKYLELNHVLQAVLDNTHTLIAYMDTDFNFIVVNQKYANADEKSPDYFLGKNHFDLYPNEENEAIFKRVVETGEAHVSMTKPFDYENHPERGTTYWDWTLMPVQDVNHKVKGVVLTLVNVTDRIRALESLEISNRALRRTQQLLRTVINNAPLIAFSIDRDGYFSLSEGKALEMLGYESGQLIGYPVSELFGHVPSIMEYIKTALDGQEIHWLSETRGLQFETTFVPLRDTNNTIIGITGTSYDVTKQMRLELELRQNNEQLEERVATRTQELVKLNEQLSAILESSTDGIALVNESGKVLRSNSALLQYFGIDELQIVDNIFEQLEDADFAELVEYASEGKVSRFQTQVKNKHQHIDITINLVNSLENVSKQYLISIHDFTLLVDVLEAEQQARMMAEALLDIPQVMGRSQDMEYVLKHVLMSLKKIITFEGGNIVLIGEEIISLVVHYGNAASDGQYQIQDILLNNQELEYLIENRKAILLNEFSFDSAKFPWISSDAKAVIISPIVFDNAVQGFISIENKAVGSFLVEQLDLLEAFTGQVALAIKTISAFQRSAELAVNQERQRLARDLHDAVSQTLFSASIIAQSLPRLLDSDIDAVQGGLQNLSVLTNSALSEMRTLLIELRPSALEETELNVLVRNLVEGLRAHIKADIEFASEDNTWSLPIPVKTNLYRIVQEACNNIIKHSQANNIKITLQNNDDLVTLKIIDDGIGFAYENIESQAMGLRIMRERANLVDIQLDIHSTLGEGTTILAEWQL